MGHGFQVIHHQAHGLVADHQRSLDLLEQAVDGTVVGVQHLEGDRDEAEAVFPTLHDASVLELVVLLDDDRLYDLVLIVVAGEDGDVLTGGVVLQAQMWELAGKDALLDLLDDHE